MKKSHMVRLALLSLAALTLSGCILVPVDDGYSRGGYYDRGRGGGSYYDRGPGGGGHHGDRHDGPDGRY